MYRAPKRTLDIVRLREKGWLFKNIAKKYGITTAWARVIYINYKERKISMAGWGKLGIREINAIKRAGYKSFEELKDIFNTIKIRHIGKITRKKINYYLKKL